MKHSGGPVHNQTWHCQKGRLSTPLAKVQLCEYKNQTLEAFVVASCLYVKLTVQWPTRMFHFL